VAVYSSLIGQRAALYPLTLTTVALLTDKEFALLAAIAEGMDEPGCGWLHELAPETHSTAGTLGSLVTKGLVISHKERAPGYPPAYWVELTAAGQQLDAKGGR
jgi:hypothetical protein